MFKKYLLAILALLIAAPALAAPFELLKATLTQVQEQTVGTPDPRADLWLRKAEEAFEQQFNEPLFEPMERASIAEQYGDTIENENVYAFCQYVSIITDQTEALELAHYQTENMAVKRMYGKVLPQSEYLLEVAEKQCEVPPIYSFRGMRRYFKSAASQYALTQTATQPKAFFMKGIGIVSSDLNLLISIGIGLLLLAGVIYMLSGLSPKISRTLRIFIPGVIVLLAKILLVTAWISSLAG